MGTEHSIHTTDKKKVEVKPESVRTTQHVDDTTTLIYHLN